MKLNLDNLLVSDTMKKKVIQIAQGEHHTIMRTDDNTLLAAGYNGYGELGIGNNN